MHRKLIALCIKIAYDEFLMQYRRTTLNKGFSASQLLNGRQIRTQIDSLLLSVAHIAQERQATDATKSQQKEPSTVQHVRTRYSVGSPCYALYCGPRHNNSPRWVQATVYSDLLHLFIFKNFVKHFNTFYTNN